MNKKILSIATAAVLAAPLAAQAEIKMSGTVQAEIGSVEVGGGDAVTTSTDGNGTIAPGGGPNRVTFNLTEDLGGGLNAFGRLDWSFSTTTGSGLGDREKFVGLEMAKSAYFRIGRIQGAYKTVQTGVDPFYATGAQGRLAGGMSGGSAFNHGGYVDNAIELGYNRDGKEGVSVALQGIADEGTGIDGSMLGSVKYTAKDFSLFGAASSLTKDGADDLMNWKVGATYKMGGLNLGLQYEDAEMVSGSGASNFTLGSNQGQFVYGSASYGLGNIILAGWVAGYMDDQGLNDGAGNASSDALSFSVGAIYTFSKNTLVYAAYHQTDSDSTKAGSDEFYDWNAFAAGVRHSF
jgi:predicted porin